jgi:hypothetical protein
MIRSALANVTACVAISILACGTSLAGTESGNAGVKAAPGTPEQVVSEFISAMHKWETETQKLSLKDPGLAFETSTPTYEKLLKRFCTASVKPQPAVFGEPPRHHPVSEKIASKEVAENKASIWTTYSDTNKEKRFYKYVLKKDHGKWKIASVLIRVGKEELESL